MYYYWLVIKIWILSLIGKKQNKKEKYLKSALEKCDCDKRKCIIKKEYKLYSERVFKKRLNELHAIKIRGSE